MYGVKPKDIGFCTTTVFSSRVLAGYYIFSVHETSGNYSMVLYVYNLVINWYIH